jgi:hypothetical protein
LWPLPLIRTSMVYVLTACKVAKAVNLPFMRILRDMF